MGSGSVGSGRVVVRGRVHGRVRGRAAGTREFDTRRESDNGIRIHPKEFHLSGRPGL